MTPAESTGVGHSWGSPGYYRALLVAQAREWLVACEAPDASWDRTAIAWRLGGGEYLVGQLVAELDRAGDVTLTEDRGEALVPGVVVLTGAVDEYVIRLEVGGGVVHDVTVAEASGLAQELVSAVATARRVETGECGR